MQTCVEAFLHSLAFGGLWLFFLRGDTVENRLCTSSLIQIVITSTTVLLSPPTVGLRQPIVTERLVEVTCAVPVVGFITSLLYNVLLLVVCTWYAFKTRMLPDNFNESRYITL